MSIIVRAEVEVRPEHLDAFRDVATQLAAASQDEPGTIQYRWFAGNPWMFLPTSVNVFPPSTLTWRLPSSVPAQTTPGCTGDSLIEMIVL